MNQKRKSKEFELRGIVDNKVVPRRRVRAMIAWTKRRLSYATPEEQLMHDALGVFTRFMCEQIRAQREYPVHLFATTARSLDFFISSGRLGIEVDGKNHYMKPQAGKDEWSDELMLKHGDILVARFSNHEVNTNMHRVIAAVVGLLRDRRDWPKNIKQELNAFAAYADTEEGWRALCAKYPYCPKPPDVAPEPEAGELTYRQLKSLPLADQIAYAMSRRAWAKLRRKTIKERGRRCEDCRQAHNVTLDLWHLTYDRIGSERMSDMLLICKNCRKSRQSPKVIKR